MLSQLRIYRTICMLLCYYTSADIGHNMILHDYSAHTSCSAASLACVRKSCTAGSSLLARGAGLAQHSACSAVAVSAQEHEWQVVWGADRQRQRGRGRGRVTNRGRDGGNRGIIPFPMSPHVPAPQHFGPSALHACTHMHAVPMPLVSNATGLWA